MSEGLVYIGKVISLEPIAEADLIVSATVVCGQGGKWQGVVRKADFDLNQMCLVYLPDSVVPEDPELEFMRASKWRVRMRRFKGVPSEVLIRKWHCFSDQIGQDVTDQMRVVKYVKEIPASLSSIAKGDFPSFLPKTDEPNYQRSPELIQALIGHRYYVTEKADGSSTTAYKWKGQFGLCSRNLELLESESSGYWQVARKYKLEEKLPEGFAIQWETCGPKIQKNPMGFKDIDGLAFSVYDIAKHNYLEASDFLDFCESIGFPTVRILKIEDDYDEQNLQDLASGCYANGKVREGVVIRSWNHINGHMISFKAINLDYETLIIGIKYE